MKNAIIDEFNSKSDFRIITQPPTAVEWLNNTEEYSVDDFRGKIRDLEQYQAIRVLGYSDDHLAAEIGLLVLELNQQICLHS